MNSETRIEVAAKLRQMADAHAATEASRIARALGLEYKVYGTVVAFDSADIYNLADLIYPTCHLLPSYDGGFGCDRCFTWFPDMKKRTSHCPECGARVVDEDDY